MAISTFRVRLSKILILILVLSLAINTNVFGFNNTNSFVNRAATQAEASGCFTGWVEFDEYGRPSAQYDTTNRLVKKWLYNQYGFLQEIIAYWDETYNKPTYLKTTMNQFGKEDSVYDIDNNLRHQYVYSARGSLKSINNFKKDPQTGQPYLYSVTSVDNIGRKSNTMDLQGRLLEEFFYESNGWLFEIKTYVVNKQGGSELYSITTRKQDQSTGCSLVVETKYFGSNNQNNNNQDNPGLKNTLLTLTAKPKNFTTKKSILKKKSVLVFGKLTDASGKAITNKVVAVKKRVVKKVKKVIKKGKNRGKRLLVRKVLWQKIKQVRTNKDGTFRFRYFPRSTSVLKAFFNGDKVLEKSTSNNLSIIVKLKR